jgi:tRNA(fMet)-specific endonuclease VapC
MYLLDMDTLTHLYSDNAQVVLHLYELADAQAGITVVSKIEMLRGRFDFLLKAAAGADLSASLVLPPPIRYG